MKVKIRERLTVKIDVRDAIFGGVALYTSIFLITALFISVADYALRFFSVIDVSGELVATSGMNVENMYPILTAAILAIFLVTFFLVILFDENLFSKHEKSLADLLGLGLVWGTAFVTIDALIETFLLYVAMYRGWESYYALSIRGLISGLPYWIMVFYIIVLPAAIYYLRHNHKEHEAKVKSNKYKAGMTTGRGRS